MFGSKKFPPIFDLHKTQKAMKRQISIQQTGYGHFKITTEYRGKEYSATTTNTQAIDRYRDSDTLIDRAGLYTTPKQAGEALYNEIKRANDLR